MGFFGIGTWEILLILVLALIIWGPGRLPEIARTLGKTVRALKKASLDFTTAITREIDVKEDNQPALPKRENPSGKNGKPLSDVAAQGTASEGTQSGNPDGHRQ